MLYIIEIIITLYENMIFVLIDIQIDLNLILINKLDNFLKKYNGINRKAIIINISSIYNNDSIYLMK